jgi:hypothetical protein
MHVTTEIINRNYDIELMYWYILSNGYVVEKIKMDKYNEYMHVIVRKNKDPQFIIRFVLYNISSSGDSISFITNMG